MGRARLAIAAGAVSNGVPCRAWFAGVDFLALFDSAGRHGSCVAGFDARGGGTRSDTGGTLRRYVAAVGIRKERRDESYESSHLWPGSGSESGARAGVWTEVLFVAGGERGCCTFSA